MTQRAPGKQERQPTNTAKVSVISSATATGSRIIPSEEVDRAFGMPVGKLRKRAGIESLAYVAENENELTLAAKAAQEALRGASCGPQHLDWIVATSETHHDYPRFRPSCIPGCLSVKIAARWTPEALVLVCSTPSPSRNR